eukprot:3649699-Rhodomonas_salina.2
MGVCLAVLLSLSSCIARMSGTDRACGDLTIPCMRMRCHAHALMQRIAGVSFETDRACVVRRQAAVGGLVERVLAFKAEDGAGLEAMVCAAISHAFAASTSRVFFCVDLICSC